LELRLRRLPLGRRVEIVRDGDVELPVAVVVEKSGADGEERILETGVAALLEGAVATAPPDGVRSAVRQVGDQPAVAVEVRPERADPEPAGVDAGAPGAGLEPPAAEVVEEAAAPVRVRLAPLRDGARHEEVGTAVAVVVAERAAADHRGDELQVPQVRRDAEV